MRSRTRQKIATPWPYFRGGELLMVRRVQKYLSIQRWFVIGMMASGGVAVLTTVTAVLTSAPLWTVNVTVALWLSWLVSVTTNWIVALLAPRVDLNTYEQVDM